MRGQRNLSSFPKTGGFYEKKVFIVFMVVVALSLAGCGKKTTTTEVQTTPEPTEGHVTTEKPEQEEIQTEEVISGTLNYIINGAG